VRVNFLQGLKGHPSLSMFIHFLSPFNSDLLTGWACIQKAKMLLRRVACSFSGQIE